jgi:hypothetical protein
LASAHSIPLWDRQHVISVAVLKVTRLPRYGVWPIHRRPHPYSWVCQQHGPPYFCGWRRLAFLDDDWRPDKSGILIESGSPTTVGSGNTILILVGNPLKTVRQQRFLDFIRKSIDQKVTMFLSLPGSPGKAKAALPLNTPEMRSAATQSRSQVRLALEDVLRRLSGHEFVPYLMEHGGNDVSA